MATWMMSPRLSQMAMNFKREPPPKWLVDMDPHQNDVVCVVCVCVLKVIRFLVLAEQRQPRRHPSIYGVPPPL